jgi:hypothetical protein
MRLIIMGSSFAREDSGVRTGRRWSDDARP